jgi:multiple sugar transport system substrate-binding protein
MSTVVELRGITWNHTRGYLPLVATAQRFSELHPDINITWQKRSLQEFADYPVERLTENFDLLVVDHPFMGYAAAHHPLLLPLDEYLPASFLADQAANSVGCSHESYSYGGHQWGLAIDAATPVSAYRPDLLEPSQVPQNWTDVLTLARRGLVALPAIPVDSLMHFYMFCCALGEEPFSSEAHVVSPDVGVAALSLLRELLSYCDPRCLERNPIATYEAMTTTDQIAYCPCAYGYVNYARPEYTQKPLRFDNLVKLDEKPLRSTLGGAGLVISAHCQQIEAALAYAQFVADPVTQRGLYFVSGGQPGHRQAWLDNKINQASDNFFLNTLATLDNAYLRPRYNGAIPLQDHAGLIVHRYLREGGDPRTALNEINALRHT